MAVVDVTKMWSKTGGSYSAALRDPFDQSYVFTEGYQVLCDAIESDTTVVASATGIPQNGSPHPGMLEAYVVNHRVTPLGPFFWLVEVGYEGETRDPATVDVKWSSVMTTEPIDRDVAGRAIVTANGEQVEGLSMDVSDAVVVITRKFATFSSGLIAPYWRATNNDSFLGYPPGTARLMSWEASNQFKYGAPNEAWTVTARVQFREPYANTTPAQAWMKRWRHEGLLVRYADGVIRRAVDSSGQEETKPVLLKADGTRETNPDAAVFIHTPVYASLPYSALGLV